MKVNLAAAIEATAAGGGDTGVCDGEEDGERRQQQHLHLKPRSSETLSLETLAVEERREGVEFAGKVRDDGDHGGD